MAMIWNNPPRWPTPPDGWVPTPAWKPPPAWPAAPDDWQFWVEDDVVEGPWDGNLLNSEDKSGGRLGYLLSLWRQLTPVGALIVGVLAVWGLWSLPVVTVGVLVMLSGLSWWIIGWTRKALLVWGVASVVGSTVTWLLAGSGAAMFAGVTVLGVPLWVIPLAGLAGLAVSGVRLNEHKEKDM